MSKPSSTFLTEWVWKMQKNMNIFPQNISRWCMCSSLGWRAHFKDPDTKDLGWAADCPCPLRQSCVTHSAVGPVNKQVPECQRRLCQQSVPQCHFRGHGNGIGSSSPWWQCSSCFVGSSTVGILSQLRFLSREWPWEWQHTLPECAGNWVGTWNVARWWLWEVVKMARWLRWLRWFSSKDGLLFLQRTRT